MSARRTDTFPSSPELQSAMVSRTSLHVDPRSGELFDKPGILVPQALQFVEEPLARGILKTGRWHLPGSDLRIVDAGRLLVPVSGVVFCEGLLQPAQFAERDTMDPRR